jgi:hypothetical protein
MEDSAAAQAAPGKACGTCMMCCKVLRIEELEKPSGLWCRHAVIGKGCGIYEDRPPVCQSFYCQWMLDPSLGPEWKPEKAKFVMFPDRKNNEVFNIIVDQAFPDAWIRPPFLAAIKKWVMDGAALGRFAVVHVGARLIAVLPDRIVEMGSAKPDPVLLRERDPTGKTVQVRIKPD